MNTLSKTIQINNIKFLKTKTPSTLFSSICNLNDEKGQKQNIVPLSRLFKSKIKVKFEPKKQINYINLKKTINNKKIFHRSMKNTALNNYKSLSYNMLPFKHSNIKLPKIKTQEEKQPDPPDNTIGKRYVSNNRKKKNKPKKTKNGNSQNKEENKNNNKKEKGNESEKSKKDKEKEKVPAIRQKEIIFDNKMKNINNMNMSNSEINNDSNSQIRIYNKKKLQRQSSPKSSKDNIYHRNTSLTNNMDNLNQNENTINNKKKTKEVKYINKDGEEVQVIEDEESGYDEKTEEKNKRKRRYGQKRKRKKKKRRK